MKLAHVRLQDVLTVRLAGSQEAAHEHTHCFVNKRLFPFSYSFRFLAETSKSTGNPVNPCSLYPATSSHTMLKATHGVQNIQLTSPCSTIGTC